jgi:xylan 1,4-beta-xylosidase
MRHLRFCCALALLLSSGAGLCGQRQADVPMVRVIAPHWVALRFLPEYPHGRHTQNPLPCEGLELSAPESTLLKGQAGQESDNKLDEAEYRISIPSFVSDAVVINEMLVADVEMNGAARGPILDGSVAHSVPNATLARFAQLHLSQPPLEHLKVFEREPIVSVVNPAEAAIDFVVTSGGSIHLHGARGSTSEGPMLLLETRNELAKPVGWSSNEPSGIELPAIAPLFDQFLRDTSIVLAPDGMYYMTGTTGGPEVMAVTADLSVWKSDDLWHWTTVRQQPRQSTVVWNIDRDGTWMKPITMRDGQPFRPLWAPEIHYINGTFWIPFSVPRHGVELLKSNSGKAEGPYEIALNPDKPLTSGIDGSLFQDDDGTVYFLNGGGWIARMKPDMSGLAEPLRHIVSASGREVGFEGVYLFKEKGTYALCAADFVSGEYNTYIATSKSLNGPWSERYLAVPHAGHANFFRDKQGRMWSTFFGNDRNSPFHARPSLVPMVQDVYGRWQPESAFRWPVAASAPPQNTAVQSAGSIGPSDGMLQQVGLMPTTKYAGAQ